MTHFLFVCLSIGLLAACQPGSLSPSAMTQWMRQPENGLYQLKNMAQYQFGVQAQPASWITWQELADSKPDSQSFRDSLSRRQQMSYFCVDLKLGQSQQSLLQHELADFQAYQDRVQFIAYEMQQDFRLIQGADTLRPALYHFERSYKLKPGIRCLMAFDLPEAPLADRQFIWTDRLFNTGPHRFLFSQTALSHIPDLKL